MMVEQESRRKLFLKAISDEYTRRIICNTMSEAKSIEEIKQESGIPISTCYRRVHSLVDIHLLRIENIVITSSGKKFEKFRSVISGATISLVSGELEIDVVINPEAQDEKLHAMWKSMKKDNEKSHLSDPVLAK